MPRTTRTPDLRAMLAAGADTHTGSRILANRIALNLARRRLQRQRAAAART